MIREMLLGRKCNHRLKGDIFKKTNGCIWRHCVVLYVVLAHFSLYGGERRPAIIAAGPIPTALVKNTVRRLVKLLRSAW